MSAKESVIDMNAYKAEVKREKADHAYLASERELVSELLHARWA